MDRYWLLKDLGVSYSHKIWEFRKNLLRLKGFLLFYFNFPVGARFYDKKSIKYSLRKCTSLLEMIESRPDRRNQEFKILTYMLFMRTSMDFIQEFFLKIPCMKSNQANLSLWSILPKLWWTSRIVFKCWITCVVKC